MKLILIYQDFFYYYATDLIKKSNVYSTLPDDVAVTGIAQQRSTYEDDDNLTNQDDSLYAAANAIDGRINGDTSKGFCSKSQ